VLIKQSLQRKEKEENKSKEREEARGERKKNLPLLSALYIILCTFLLKSLSLNFSSMSLDFRAFSFCDAIHLTYTYLFAHGAKCFGEIFGIWKKPAGFALLTGASVQDK